MEAMVCRRIARLRLSQILCASVSECPDVGELLRVTTGRRIDGGLAE